MQLIKKSLIRVLTSAVTLLLMFTMLGLTAKSYNPHADETNTWNLSKRVTVKQFSTLSRVKGSMGIFSGSNSSKTNKINSKKVVHYLVRIRNLNHYKLYFVQSNNLGGYNADVGSNGENLGKIITTVYFIRK